MKQYLRVSLVVFTFFFLSCEKVIDISVRDADQKYVIEGVITNSSEHHFVKITTTKNLSDNNDFPPVRNATVSVSNQSGDVFVFEEGEDGLYKPSSLTGVSGQTYTLTVQIGNERFTAESTMPAKVKMDTLYITEDFLFGQVRKSANLVYKDPGGERNYYRFIQFIDDVKYNRVFVTNDEYTNGNTVTEKLRTPSDDEDHVIASGDTVTIHALCIDKANNDYWYSYLSAGATGGSGTASPANPTTNIRGGALGYFSAHTVQILEAVAP